jgi:hypothetical protein
MNRSLSRRVAAAEVGVRPTPAVVMYYRLGPDAWELVAPSPVPGDPPALADRASVESWRASNPHHVFILDRWAQP